MPGGGLSTEHRRLFTRILQSSRPILPLPSGAFSIELARPSGPIFPPFPKRWTITGGSGTLPTWEAPCEGTGRSWEKKSALTRQWGCISTQSSFTNGSTIWKSWPLT
ncbi:MAG: hypothetical protein JW891_18090 [Candidatus Lokiarchaeota archaeon]|nr:hypothetical protein [Candidatus Lokiarchaeota archaeon]